MKRIFLDAWYIIALVNERDEFHERANQLADVYESSLLVVTDAVLLEIGNSLAREFRTEAASVIDQFFLSSDIEIVSLDENLFHKGFSLYKARSDKTWGLIDCISFVVMREYGITDALTHDRHFTQAGFKALMRDPIH